MAIKADALLVAVLNTATAVAALTGVAIPQGPGLEPGFSIALEKQLHLPQGAGFLSIPYASTLLQPVVETACGGGQGLALWPASQPGGGRQFPGSADETKAGGYAVHLPTGAGRDVLLHKPSRICWTVAVLPVQSWLSAATKARPACP